MGGTVRTRHILQPTSEQSACHSSASPEQSTCQHDRERDRERQTGWKVSEPSARHTETRSEYEIASRVQRRASPSRPSPAPRGPGHSPDCPGVTCQSTRGMIWPRPCYYRVQFGLSFFVTKHSLVQTILYTEIIWFRPFYHRA